MRITLLSVIALAIGVGIALYQTKSAVVQDKGSKSLGVAGLQVGGDFELLNQDGQPTHLKDFDGQYKLIYFGFTYCPAICPTELQKISQALNELGARAEQIQPLFVTVDPERDTAEVMREYVTLFHPRLIGLTGNPEDVAKVLKQYRVFANKVETEDNSDYTMDHSSFIYLMDKNNELLSIYRIQDDVNFIVRDIRSTLGNP